MIDYRKYQEGEGLFSGINIVPFTDVVLVLLIIFMIAAPGLLTGMNISLPGSSSADPDVPASVTVGLDREGRIFLDGRGLENAAELTEEIQSLVQRRSNLAVVLNADSAARHGQVVEVMDGLRNSGVKKIYVGTVQK